MSNIPKFRAYNTTTMRMFDVVKIDIMLNRIEYVDKKDGCHGWCYITSTEDKFMQSTGLRDKNGVEIYEGDIVKNTTQKVYLAHKFVVVWNENWACFQLINDGKASNIPLSQDEMSYEVIGNIYENKELLEQ